MSAEDYMEPAVAEQARSLAAQLAASDTDTYDRAIDLFSLLGMNLPDNVPGRLYAVWGELTDAWELHPKRRAETEAMMREAASELAAIETETALAAYLSAWCQRLGVR